jgi:hypothetical protein
MATRRNFFKYLGLAGGVASGGIVAAAAVLPDNSKKECIEQIEKNIKNSGYSIQFTDTYGEEKKERMRISSDGNWGIPAFHNPQYVPGTENHVVVGMKAGPDGELYLKVNGKWRRIVTE